MNGPSVCTSPNIYLRCHHDCQDISHSDVYCPCHQDCGQEWVTNKTSASVSTPGISIVAPDITWKHQFAWRGFFYILLKSHRTVGHLLQICVEHLRRAKISQLSWSKSVVGVKSESLLILIINSPRNDQNVSIK